jgi:hypothetical protein
LRSTTHFSPQNQFFFTILSCVSERGVWSALYALILCKILISWRSSQIPTIAGTFQECLKELERFVNRSLNNPHNPCNTFYPYHVMMTWFEFLFITSAHAPLRHGHALGHTTDTPYDFSYRVSMNTMLYCFISDLGCPSATIFNFSTQNCIYHILYTIRTIFMLIK